MSTKTYSIANFTLKSTWTVNGTTYGTPTTASKTVTLDVSDIPKGSKVTSATFKATTNNASGDTYATCNSTRINLTNSQASSGKDAAAWLSGMTGGTFSSLSIKFTHQGYGGTSSGSSTCNLSAISLVVNYEDASTGTLSATSVTAGDDASISLTVKPTNANYEHTVKWTFGNETNTYTLAAGTKKSTWSIPLTFCAQIPNATSGTGSAVLTTYNSSTHTSSTRVGSAKTYSFTVKVPSSVKPTAGALSATSVTSAAPNTWSGLYVKGLSYASMSLPNVAGAQGSTISKVEFSGWGATANGTKSGTTYSCNSGTLNTSGTVTLTATVTDSRGRTCAKTLDISVLAYASPKIETISVYRCSSNGTRSDTGTYAALKVNYSISSVSGRNTATTASAYKLSTASSYTAANTAFGDNTATVLSVGSVFATDKSYNIRATVSDTVGNSATATILLPTAEYVMHFLNGGKSIGIGQAASTTQKTLTVSPDWTVNIGGVNVNSKFSGIDSSISNLQTAVTNAASADVAASRITGTLLVGHGGTGQTSVAGVRTWLRTVYNAGDTMTFRNFTTFPGIITSSNTKVFITINTGRLINADEVTMSGKCWLITDRKIAGDENPVSVTSIGTSRSVAKTNGTGIVLITFTGDFSGSNNVPAMLVTGDDFTLTFKDNET